MTDPYLSALVRELKSHGVTQYEVKKGRKHRRLIFTFQGREMFYVMPSTSSDFRAPLNAQSDLRRLMGVERVITKSASPRPRKRRLEAEPECPCLTVRPDPFAALQSVCVDPLLGPMLKRLEDRIRQAEWRLSFSPVSFARWSRGRKVPA